MNREHKYNLNLRWTGNTGLGTLSYHDYERSYEISINGKPVIMGSSDPEYNGDPSKYNPEDLLVASLSACHMLWYLHLCAENGIVVVDYLESAIGVMIETKNGSGYFKEVCLNPTVIVSEPGMHEEAKALHAAANNMCFIANSCSFPVFHRPIIKTKEVAL